MAGRKLDLDRQQTSLRMHSDAIIRTLVVGGNTPDGWPHCGVLAAAPAASACSLSRHVHELGGFPEDAQGTTSIRVWPPVYGTCASSGLTKGRDCTQQRWVCCWHRHSSGSEWCGGGTTHRYVAAIAASWWACASHHHCYGVGSSRRKNWSPYWAGL